MASSTVLNNFTRNSMLAHHQFKAFDTEIVIGIVNENNDSNHYQKLFAIIEQQAKKFEQKFSRFTAQSELSKINKSRKTQIKVSKEMLDLLIEAKKGFKITNGLFDPTVLVSLNNVGYDNSFNKVVTKRFSWTEVKKNFEKRAKFNTLKIDKLKNSITVPHNFNLDLGGIAKGYWVDQTRRLLDKNCRNFWVSAGGDLYIKGKSESKQNWQIGVQNPLDLHADILNLNVPPKGIGIATSGITKRQGTNGESTWHHIINPLNGMPVKNNVLAVTIVANSATNADIMAKIILILGVKKGLAKLNSMENYDGIIIDKNSKIHASKGIKKFL